MEDNIVNLHLSNQALVADFSPAFLRFISSQTPIHPSQGTEFLDAWQMACAS